MKLIRAGLTMVIFWSLMVNARTSFLLHGSWPGAGADKRHVPLDQTSRCLLSLFEDWGGMLFANVCAGFIRLCCGIGGKRRCLRTLGSPGGSTHLGSISFANLPSCVCGTWATQACLSLDTPFGRSSERASSAWLSGSSPDNWEVCHYS